jgi:hypothetical protein
MRASIASIIWRFSTTRMLHEYAERLYLPAAGVTTMTIEPVPAVGDGFAQTVESAGDGAEDRAGDEAGARIGDDGAREDGARDRAGEDAAAEAVAETVTEAS